MGAWGGAEAVPFWKVALGGGAWPKGLVAAGVLVDMSIAVLVGALPKGFAAAGVLLDVSIAALLKGPAVGPLLVDGPTPKAFGWGVAWPKEVAVDADAPNGFGFAAWPNGLGFC